MKLVMLLVLVGCAAPEATDAIDVVAFRDPACGPNAAEDCVVLVPPGAHVALPAEGFELFVHGPGELPPLAVSVDGAPVATLQLDQTCDASGTTATLLVPPLGYGAVDIAGELGFRAIDPARSSRYGSTYSSNCYCLSCITYCSVNGKTEKAGTCC